MPNSAIKGKDSEKVWGNARSAADKQYPGLSSKDPDKYYAIVMTIYKKMCTKHSCTPKSESLESVLERLEMLEGVSGAVLKSPKGARGWVLYDDNPKAAKEAAKDLSNGLARAASDIAKWMKKNPAKPADFDKTVGKILGQAWGKHMSPRFEKYRGLGADDTETRYVGAQALIDMIKSFYGVKGYTSLGDWI